MDILQYLNTALSVSKRFTKPFIDEVKLCKDDLRGINTYQKRQNVDQNVRIKDRYAFNSKYIFQTHRSLKAKVVKNTPKLIYAKSGKDDSGKKELLEAMDRYLTDKCNLQNFYRKSVHQLLLYGQVTSQQAYKVITNGSQQLLSHGGAPVLDENGEVVEKPITIYDDPVVFVDNPQKTYFSPGSVHTEDCVDIPYIIREKTMSPDQIQDLYNIKVDADTVSGVSGELSDAEKEVIGAVTIYEYIGRVPSNVAGGGKSVRIIFTASKILHQEEYEKYCASAKLYGDDDTSEDFFGYGLAYILRDVQKEQSITKSQLLKMRDMYAYPKPIIKDSERLDLRALTGTQGTEILKYTETPPTYLVPPSPPGSIMAADQAMESEAQSQSGSMDMSKGGQQTNTVKTATGQQIFAESMEVLVEDVKKILGEYYRVTMVNLLKLCQRNWSESKILSITDDETGEEQQYMVDASVLQSINFDTDVDVQIEDVTYNKDIKRRDILNMNSTMLESEVVNKEELARYVLKEAFGIKDYEKFIVPKTEQQDPSTAGQFPGLAGESEQLPNQSDYAGPYGSFPTGPRV